MRPYVYRDTVVVVHGTFDAPKPGELKWYQPGGAFCRRLDEELEKQGSSARCWAHCADGKHSPFTWDGRNNWRSRNEAADALKDYLQGLLLDGWRCHLVAHSHGGNVVIRALHQKIAHYTMNQFSNPADEGLSLEQYRSEDRWYTWSGPGGIGLGEVVCLGTPFIDMPHFNFDELGPTGREERWMAGWSITLSCLLILAAAYLWTLRFRSDTVFYWFTIIFCGLSLLYSLSAIYQSVLRLLSTWMLLSRQRNLQAVQDEKSANRPRRDLSYWTHLLVQNSPHDEARILLETFEAPKLGFKIGPLRRAFCFLWSRTRESIVLWGRILIAAFFKSAERWPIITESDRKLSRRYAKIAVVTIFWAGFIALSALIVFYFSWQTNGFRLDVMLIILAVVVIPVIVHPAGGHRLKSFANALIGPMRQIAMAALERFPS